MAEEYKIIKGIMEQSDEETKEILSELILECFCVG